MLVVVAVAVVETIYGEIASHESIHVFPSVLARITLISDALEKI